MTAADGSPEFAYLLGELPEAEAAAFEDAVFADPERFAQLESFETELIDAFATGALPAERRARFEARFLHTPQQRERVAFARALHQRAQQPARAATPWWRAWTVPKWSLAGLAAVAAALLLWVALPGGEQALRVSLHPQGVRGPGAPQALTVGPRVKRLTLELSLGDEPARTSWEVSVTGPGGLRWQGSPVHADAVAVEVVPEVRWQPGLHRVTLSSGGAPVLEYELLVEAGP